MTEGTLTPNTSESNEHYTPGYIVEAARATLGNIDLDPFSCQLANTVVKADAIFSRDGFTLPWYGAIFCNPPGGKVGRESSQALAWRKLMTEHEAGRVHSAIFVCFNLGFLQVSQSQSGPHPLDFPICYPKTRVSYLVDRLPGPTPKQPNRKPTKKQQADYEATGLCEGDSPPGASCVVFVPPVLSGSRALCVARFCEAFEPIGRVVVPEARRAAA